MPLRPWRCQAPALRVSRGEWLWGGLSVPLPSFAAPVSSSAIWSLEKRNQQRHCFTQRCASSLWGVRHECHGSKGGMVEGVAHAGSLWTTRPNADTRCAISYPRDFAVKVMEIIWDMKGFSLFFKAKFYLIYCERDILNSMRWWEIGKVPWHISLIQNTMPFLRLRCLGGHIGNCVFIPSGQNVWGPLICQTLHWALCLYQWAEVIPLSPFMEFVF